MLTRVASAAVLGPLVVAAAWLGGAWWGALVTIAALLATREAHGIVRPTARDEGRMGPERLVGYALVAALALAPLGDDALGAWLPRDQGGGDLALWMLASTVTATFLLQMRRPPGERSILDWAIALAVPVYVGVLASFAVALRVLPEGRAWVVAWLVLVWVNDSFAYLGGRRFGRTPLAPALSPRKTREGLAIATAATVVAAAAPLLASAAGLGGRPSIPAQALVGVALAVSLVGPLGDLSVSFLKRQTGVKDSGHLIPGHGGLLDRTDSLLFSAPWAYLVALAATALAAGGAPAP